MQGTWVSFLLWEDSTCGRATKAPERKVEVLAAQLCGTLCNLMITVLVKNPPVTQETPVQFLGREDPLEKREATHSSTLGLPFGSAGKESTCNVGDLDSIPGEDPLEKEKATYCSILAWRIPWMYIVHMVVKSRSGLSDFHFHFFSLCNPMDCTLPGFLSMEFSR